jgi:hypothetical protein
LNQSDPKQARRQRDLDLAVWCIANVALTITTFSIKVDQPVLARLIQSFSTAQLS